MKKEQCSLEIQLLLFNLIQLQSTIQSTMDNMHFKNFKLRKLTNYTESLVLFAVVPVLGMCGTEEGNFSRKRPPAAPVRMGSHLECERRKHRQRKIQMHIVRDTC